MGDIGALIPLEEGDDDSRGRLGAQSHRQTDAVGSRTGEAIELSMN
jgi:hypothetical protein